MGIFAMVVDAVAAIGKVSKAKVSNEGNFRTALDTLSKNVDALKVKLSGRTKLGHFENADLSKALGELDTVARQQSKVFDGRVSKMILESDAYKFLSDLKAKQARPGAKAADAMKKGDLKDVNAAPEVETALITAGAKVKGASVVLPNGFKIKTKDVKALTASNIEEFAKLTAKTPWHKRLRAFTDSVELPIIITGLLIPMLVASLLTRSLSSEDDACDTSTVTGECSMDSFMDGLLPDMSIAGRLLVVSGSFLLCCCCCCSVVCAIFVLFATGSS